MLLKKTLVFLAWKRIALKKNVPQGRSLPMRCQHHIISPAPNVVNPETTHRYIGVILCLLLPFGDLLKTSRSTSGLPHFFCEAFAGQLPMLFCPRRGPPRATILCSLFQMDTSVCFFQVKNLKSNGFPRFKISKPPVLDGFQ